MPLALPIGRGRRPRRRLRDEHYLLDALLQSIGTAVVACGADGRLTHANRCTRELIGADCPLGTDPETWIRELRPRTPSGLPLAREDLPPVRALQGEVCSVDVLVSIRGCEVLLGTVSSPVNDEHGRRRGAVVLLEDVTEQRRREAQVREELRSKATDSAGPASQAAQPRLGT